VQRRPQGRALDTTKVDKRLPSSTPSSPGEFAIALGNEQNAKASNTPVNETSIQKIGESEKQILPSGIVLLTGGAAEKRALELAKKAPEFANDLNRVMLGSKHKVLAVWGDIIITGIVPVKPDDPNKTEGETLKNLSDTVRSLEEGMKYKKGREIISGIVDSAIYPTAISISRYHENDHAPADGVETFMDKVIYNPYQTVILNRRAIPPWIALYHELGHSIYENNVRKKVFERTYDCYDDNWQKKECTPTTIERLTSDQQLPFDKQPIQDDEKFATKEERELTEQVNLKLSEDEKIPVRKRYTDAVEGAIISDPIYPVIIKKIP
jgi:hypothetical protein